MLHYGLEHIGEVVFRVVCLEEFGGTGTFERSGSIRGPDVALLVCIAPDPRQLLIEP